MLFPTTNTPMKFEPCHQKGVEYTLDREKLRFAVYDEYSSGSGPETVKERDSWYGG